METDVKTKYLDITQLPVSEEQEPSFEDQQQSFYKSILGKYTEFERRALIEGCWGESPLKQFMGVDYASGVDVTRVFGIPPEYLYGEDRRVGIPYNTGYCTPSRSYNYTMRNIKREWVGE